MKRIMSSHSTGYSTSYSTSSHLLSPCEQEFRKP